MAPEGGVQYRVSQHLFRLYQISQIFSFQYRKLTIVSWDNIAYHKFQDLNIGNSPPISRITTKNGPISRITKYPFRSPIIQWCLQFIPFVINQDMINCMSGIFLLSNSSSNYCTSILLAITAAKATASTLGVDLDIRSAVEAFILGMYTKFRFTKQVDAWCTLKGPWKGLWAILDTSFFLKRYAVLAWKI